MTKVMTEKQLHETVADIVRETSEPMAEQMTEALRQAAEASEEAKHWAVALREQLARQAPAPAPAEMGLTAAGIVKCIAASRVKYRDPATIALEVYGADSEVTKALSAGDADAG